MRIKLKKFFKWLIPQAASSGLSYYATKRGMIVGGKKAGEAIKKQVSIAFNRRF